MSLESYRKSVQKLENERIDLHDKISRLETSLAEAKTIQHTQVSPNMNSIASAGRGHLLDHGRDEFSLKYWEPASQKLKVPTLENRTHIQNYIFPPKFRSMPLQLFICMYLIFIL